MLERLLKQAYFCKYYGHYFVYLRTEVNVDLTSHVRY
jgi:hypothetical protein